MENISIESVSKRFEAHLAIPNNNRIIFSGKFGIGKTWFLNEFFKEREKAFNKILISPVNYAVSSNEDIFELIKADIIKDLFLTGKVELKQLPKDKGLQKIGNFIEDNQIVFAKFLLKMLRRLNPTLEIPIQLMEVIRDIFKVYGTKPKKSSEKTLTEEATEYWYETNETIGGIYEHNYITKVINALLDTIRVKGNKKNVLVIDDLDRIDPEHIFRILNVLSAHNNQLVEQNKFSIDYIVIVCDIENIKKIFYHKYGKDVDFDGYIDKFYTTELFEFTNNDAIDNYIKNTFDTESDGFVALIQLLLVSFTKANLVTVRNLIKHRHELQIDNVILYEYDMENQADNMHLFHRPTFIKGLGKLQINSDEVAIIQLLKLMSFVFGSFTIFFDKLKGYDIPWSKIEKEKLIWILQFLELQKHFATQNKHTLFWQAIETTPGKVNFDWPHINSTTTGVQFRIELQWNWNNLYQFKEHYFKGARLWPLREEMAVRKVGLIDKISETTIIELLKEVIMDFHAAGYLKKCGIVFNL